MRFHALACDYDGTLASEGRVPERVLEALERLKRSGRTLILVTGRTQEEFLDRFPAIRLFSRVVLENGAVMFRPESGDVEILAKRPPPEFLERLKAGGVAPLVAGKVIVATREPHETTVLEVIRELGLEMHVVFNKGAVMALPSGVNKASGMAAALRELGLSPHNVVGVGDAENDHAFLERCECSVAVANALPAVKEKVDWVTRSPEGEGVAELIRQLQADDFAEIEPRLLRHEVPLGEEEDGRPVRLSPYGRGLLIVGPSGSGKSTLAGGILERLRQAGYQCLIVDPEGDYQEIEGITALGGRSSVPSVKEALDVLEHPDETLALNLLGIRLEERPGYLQSLLPALMSRQGLSGRPHWIVLDEAQHLFPNAGPSAEWKLTQRPDALMLVTVDPEQLSPDFLSWIDVSIFLGPGASELLGAFLTLVGRPAVRVGRNPKGPPEALLWERSRPSEARLFRSLPCELQRRRHHRKYAEGDLGPDKSFYFRGPEGKLKLRAQNLLIFLQMADGVDDGTWQFHLERGDFSRWFRDAIKDVGLSTLARGVETSAVRPSESRAMIRKLVEDLYTSPV
jgi:HAD superfamily hydrolase (TIGR01484 family)